MKNLVIVLCIALTVASGYGQKKTKPSPRNGKGPIGAGRAGSGAISKNWKVAPGLEARLAKYRPVRMPFNSAKLKPRERQMVEKLVEASQYLENIFWRQNDPEALTLYQQLANSTSPQDRTLRELLFLNAGRFDLLDNNQPFLGTNAAPPGHAFYPEGLTREQIESYVKAHPDQKEAIYSSYTVIRRRGDVLEALPYRVVYRAYLGPAAKALKEAAALSDDPDFANFLRLRSKALLTDDYTASDFAWLDLKDPKFDIIFAPQ